MTATPGIVDEADRTRTATPDSSSVFRYSTHRVLRSSNTPTESGFPQMTSIPNDDDDASDVSMSAETEDSDDDSQSDSQDVTSQKYSQTTTMEPLIMGQKRKLSFGHSTSVTQSSGIRESENYKRLKLEIGSDSALLKFRDEDGHLCNDRSLLPAEIWHHIFTFTSPRALGRSLQVNKVFRAYLDPSSSTSPHSLASLSISVAPIRTPEAIWQASRKLYLNGMPSPIKGLTELDMWRLVCTSKCQFCGREGQRAPSNLADIWHSGPGDTDVTSIWPFAVRSCGACLQQRSIKEIDFLLSSSVPLPLMTALPFVFLTSDLHMISSTVLQHTQIPAHMQIVKYFFRPHVEDIKMEFFKVNAMGSGTSEEWLKGLDDRGREKRNDTSRWERWEATGGVQRMLSIETVENLEAFGKPKVVSTGSTLPSTVMRPPPISVTPRPHLSVSGGIQANGFHPERPNSALFAPNIPPRFDSPSQNGFTSYPSRHFQQSRHERTKEEAAELKATRRAEIERRCMLLDPPLKPTVLSHMASFQAAMQIVKPLDDGAWEVLKPRLLSQREEAEQRENDLVAQNRVVQDKHVERRQLDIHPKEVKDVNDREWDEIQAPLRARIGGYADEIVRDGWQGGEKVTKESSPKFAAELLIYVRKRFYAEVAKDEAAARAAGHEPLVDPPNGPFTQKLILENMKWVFDTKIKPLTEQYSKELFLCNGCENNFKVYGFEGVIQHYAAKHTSALSVGSIVVHWKAEWPEYPPFNPDPGSAIGTFHSAAKPSSLYSNGAATSPHIPGFGGYPPVSGQAAIPVQTQQPPGYQQSSGSYYGHSQYADQYPMSQSGPFVQAPGMQGQSQGFHGPSYQGPHVGGYQPYPSQGYAVQSYDGPYPSGSSMTFDSPHPSQVYPVQMVEQPGQMFPQAVPFQAAGQYNTGPYNNVPYNAVPHPVVPIRTEAYKNQLHDVALTAREVWNQTTGVKDMPGSVRVYVILFHILKRSRAKYADDPPLSMLIDGLSNDKDMRPVRNVNGLACRACKLGKTNTGTNPYKGSSKGSGTTEKKLLSLPQLLNHFQSNHIEGLEPTIYDWTQDMVDLPDTARINALARAHGMDDHKMRLIAEALPEAFRVSPPQAEHEKAEVSYQYFPRDEEEHHYVQLAPSRDDHRKYYTSEPDTRYLGADADQYDPSEISSGRVIHDGPIFVKSSRRHHLRDRQSQYQETASLGYIERKASSPSATVRTIDEYGRHVMRDDGHFYSEPATQYRESDSVYRTRRVQAQEVIPYNDQVAPRNDHGYVPEVSLPRLLEMTDRLTTTNPVRRGPQVLLVNNEPKPRSVPSRPVSHPSPTSRNQQSSRIDPIDGGSEDGELRIQSTQIPPLESIPSSIEASNAAERFLNEFQPGGNAEEYAKRADEAERHDEDPLRTRWEIERVDSMRRMHQPPAEAHPRMSDRLDDEGRATVISLPPTSTDKSPEPRHSRPRHERALQPQNTEAHDYEDRFTKPTLESSFPRAHSPEMGDQRYRVNNTFYREDRQVIRGTRTTPSRFARYESVRMENDRPRSGSPIYVKIGALPGQYRERSPPSRYPQQEPVYRTRTPQPPVQEISYERIPRQEYYRVYADEHRPRQTHHEGHVEYVQVADSKGDYLIRRPARREPEPVYTTYEEGTFPPRQAVYETRAPVSRSDPAYYEEYDPRHPAPPPSTTIRQMKYE